MSKVKELAKSGMESNTGKPKAKYKTKWNRVFAVVHSNHNTLNK